MTKQEFEALASGNENALSAFYKANYSYVTGWLVYRTRCPEDRVDEVYDDAVLRVRDKAISGDLKFGNIRAYLLRTAITRWYETRRGETNLLKQHENYLKEQPDEYIELDYDLLLKQEVEDQQETRRRRIMALVHQAMAKLSESCQRLLNDTMVNGIKVGNLVEAYGLKDARGVTARKQDCKNQFKNHYNRIALDKGWDIKW